MSKPINPCLSSDLKIYVRKNPIAFSIWLIFTLLELLIIVFPELFFLPFEFLLPYRQAPIAVTLIVAMIIPIFPLLAYFFLNHSYSKAILVKKSKAPLIVASISFLVFVLMFLISSPNRLA